MCHECALPQSCKVDCNLIATMFHQFMFLGGKSHFPKPLRFLYILNARQSSSHIPEERQADPSKAPCISLTQLLTIYGFIPNKESADPVTRLENLMFRLITF